MKKEKVIKTKKKIEKVQKAMSASLINNFLLKVNQSKKDHYPQKQIPSCRVKV